MRGATTQLVKPSYRCTISIHAPHARSDVTSWRCGTHFYHFNPRSSCEERHNIRIKGYNKANFNPRSSCEERHLRFACLSCRSHISIHAPHARSDCQAMQVRLCSTISIHAPHARSDNPRTSEDEAETTFQSTLLMRGATPEGIKIILLQRFQSTLLMRGATR